MGRGGTTGGRSISGVSLISDAGQVGAGGVGSSGGAGERKGEGIVDTEPDGYVQGLPRSVVWMELLDAVVWRVSSGFSP